MVQTGRSRVQDPMWLFFFFSIYLIILASPWDWGLLGLKHKRVPETEKKRFLGAESGRRVIFTASPPSVARLCKQCGILNIS
jgi:hypothetical protein